MGVAEAVVLPPGYYNNRPEVLICPLDAGRGLQTSYMISSDRDRFDLPALMSAHHDNVVLVEEIEPHHQGGARVVTTIGGASHRRMGSIPEHEI